MERREFLQKASALTVATQMPWLMPRGYGGQLLDADLERILVNDVHSAHNATWVKEIQSVTSNEQIQNSVRTAAKENISVSIAGGRHALGSQQFATDSFLLDTTLLNNIITDSNIINNNVSIFDSNPATFRKCISISNRQITYSYITIILKIENGC